MKSFEFHAHTSPDGTLIVHVPAVLADSDVRVVVEKSVHKNGAARTPHERYESLRRIAGSINDPSFERPSQGEFEDRELFD